MAAWLGDETAVALPAPHLVGANGRHNDVGDAVASRVAQSDGLILIVLDVLPAIGEAPLPVIGPRLRGLLAAGYQIEVTVAIQVG